MGLFSIIVPLVSHFSSLGVDYASKNHYPGHGKTMPVSLPEGRKQEKITIGSNTHRKKV